MVNEDELRALASKWKQTAMEQVPAAYADRGLHGKYLKLDNYAAGLDDCAIELLELLDPRSPTLREAETPIREALCDCKSHHNFQEVAINYCFECKRPLHS